jgi:dipeptidyl aminopeptidase/acylaminoacyl peptidase
LDGKKLEGIIYKPANFDPNKKYPMIVNFYERNSETLYKYHMPEAHRSTIDYSMYLSNGYIVFNPDIRYRDGFPGESCYNCVMSGISEVLSRGYVDEARIGAQGHSWGGYQVAYLATRTRLFAAIESGAPVVNMYSAYGGIRWGSGLARSFQYEHTQSRLGATPWTDSRRYYENSPLFLMDKVETPILIMHNDQDGHVPWYQGIEYFVALKRLGKPAWMLNYTGEPHWPTKNPNKLDFQIRMKQFFDHFLKGEPMPKWMKEGVPAVKQPYELGY